MKKIVCLCNELQFVEFILSKARALQVLSIMLSSSALCSNEEAITHIIEYPRASPDAQVIFLGRESANNGSANISSETAEAEESHTTDSEHDSINSDTDDDDSEEEEVQATSSEPGSIKALSSLTIDILDNIFSRLHIYDVVRTSALSREWRRRWESLPSVDLSHSTGISASDIDALLLRRGTTPVVAFRLLALDPSWGARGYIDDWLLYLSRRGVQDLALGFSSRCGFVQMHSCLFSCRKLTRLSLMSCRIPPAPAGFAGFPNLKALRLEGVIVEKGAGHAGGEFAALIAAAPVLEEAEFVLVILPGDGSCAEQEWTIRAPNLRKLSIFVIDSPLTQTNGRRIAGNGINEDVVTDIAQHSRASPNAQAIFMGREPESANHQDKGFLTWTDEDSTEEEQANAARPRRRQRRNFESVAQMDQLEEEILKLAKKRDQIAMESLGVSKEINMILKEHRKQQNYNNSAVQLLCERNNINYHELLQRMSGRSPDHPLGAKWRARRRAGSRGWRRRRRLRRWTCSRRCPSRSCLLDNILSRLHVYDMVCTSALARAWRRRWESLPTVDLTRNRGLVAEDVDALLLRRTAPIRTFRLGAYDDSWYVDALHDWILHLSRNGVQNLFLWFPPIKFRLHLGLFSCGGLTCLNLTSCRLPPTPPEFAGFPSLKILLLDKVAISEHGGRELAALIGASPLIEEMKLVRVELIGDNPEDEWVLRAPNLRVVTIASGLPYGGSIEHLPLHTSAGLNGCNYAKFLMGMRQVTKLEFATASNWVYLQFNPYILCLLHVSCAYECVIM
ncbi:hypothetical protein PR202_ga21182 [Eleusine coracana subsp. coracana]|uniref:F-box domain-containing protein n=1 Tax=Eleusine coracana subsp. coracana TaxID=191504 RepID=A0AAV5CZ07_ELECO|nr:hypothetical protein PR202_ga21182 [Eleusine coracana subsp. coracana]